MYWRFCVLNSSGDPGRSIRTARIEPGEPVILDATADAGKAYADTVDRLLGEERPFRHLKKRRKVSQTPVRG